MKNQYFGDEKDYLTYGLLRAIARSSGLRIGVAWMLTPNETNREGELRTYLTPTQRLLWEHHDPELYEQLTKIAEAGRRVDLAQEWNLIPGASYDQTIIPGDARARTVVFSRLFERLKECEILFFDPDNGLETQNTAHGIKRSAQHLYWNEVEQAYTRQHHSLLIFQHFPRRGRTEYLEERAVEIAQHLGIARVDWFQTAQVAFFLAARPEHAAALEKVPTQVLTHWRGRISHGVFPTPLEPAPVQADPPGTQAQVHGPEASAQVISDLTLYVWPERYAVYRLPPDAALPDWANGRLVSITRTPAELSIVCAEREARPAGYPGSGKMKVETGWRILQVAGPLAFHLTGVLAGLTAPLAQAGISLFAISTFDTDYLLVKELNLEAAIRTLRAAGKRVERND